MIKTPKQITIFEGPDGGGKTTAARRFADRTDAHYVHFKNLPSVSSSLPRFYVEAMLPALLGYQDVVLDRCWLSERPYGNAFRGGRDRVGVIYSRMLDRLAMRCGAVVVLCMPGEDVAVANFNRRRQAEMLDTEAQLRQVYHGYTLPHQLTQLPLYLYNYLNHDIELVDSALLKRIRMPLHQVGVRSAGNLDASVVLVGEGFCTHKENDPLYQWPFASFSWLGCSTWLTRHLEDADIGEDELMWVNADQLTKHTTFRPDQSIIALGSEAGRRLTAFDHDHLLVEHPQFWKRFKGSDEYKLANIVKGVL